MCVHMFCPLGRVLVGEGVLVKLCRKRPKARQFFLFNDVLIYGNILMAKKRYNKQHIIPLEEVQLENLPDEGGQFILYSEYAFVLIVVCTVQNRKMDG